MTDHPNNEAYPFPAHFFETEAGKMHYVDQGSGPLLLFVHGTPAWSFTYRHLIAALSDRYRCIAPDHLGFGKSDKPADADYSPKAHAERLARFIDHLGLTDLTLVVHDFGGPIGLSYALARPQHIRRIILLNTWMWPLNDYPDIVRGAKIAGSWLGRMLYKYFNFSPKVLVRQAFYDKSRLTEDVHRQYTSVFPDAASRKGPMAFARHLMDSSDWYAQLWAQKDILQHKEVMIIWGKRDPLLPYALLQRWKKTLDTAEIHELESGHFVMEEKPEECIQLIRQFADSSIGQDRS